MVMLSTCMAAADTLKQSKLMKDSLEITQEITKLIKHSPRRDVIFQRLKETLPVGSTPGIRVLCRTRWTVHAESVNSITTNYKTLEKTWEEALQVTQDTETKARTLARITDEEIHVLLQIHAQ